MHWDWNTYNNQPKEFIEVINIIKREEAKSAMRK